MDQLYLFDGFDEDKPEENTTDNTKVCRICKIEKSVEEFYLDRGAVYSKCKDCCKEYSVNLKQAKENAPNKPENNSCQCCGKLTEKWYCDHHPNTNLFRGWVCFECNTAAGNVGDHYTGAVKLLNYLYNRRQY